MCSIYVTVLHRRRIFNELVRIFNLSVHHHSTGYPQAPLQDFTTEDVWNYLLKNKMNPWGTNNRDLLSMYQDANATECPLVVDTNTSSCGNSRFGCWVCTVVERDRHGKSHRQWRIMDGTSPRGEL